MMIIYKIEPEISGKITGPCNIGEGQMGAGTEMT